MTTDKRPTTFRLSEQARSMIVRLAELHGVSYTDVLEMAIREKARRDLPDAGHAQSPPAPKKKSKRK